ncbi:hypothetical protein TPR58_20520 [Sphingomonas sp. HF-S3]|uniref:DUF1214 domain-containing protein n=1 Tax=Sphingomonas rustica TaxID=3103142 RepID=A0ABV0BDH4_9SPHN
MFDIGWIAGAVLMTAAGGVTVDARAGQSTDWSRAVVGHWYWSHSAASLHYYFDQDSISGPDTDRRVRIAVNTDAPVIDSAWQTMTFSFDCRARTYRILAFISYPPGASARPLRRPPEFLTPTRAPIPSLQNDLIDAACDDDLGSMVELGRPLEDAAHLAHLLGPLVRSDLLLAGPLAAASREKVRAMPDEELARWVKPGRTAQVRALLER